MASLGRHFFAGGAGMYPILICSIVMIAAGLTAITSLWAPRPDVEALLVDIDAALARGDVDGAILVAITRGRAAGRIALAGLRESLQRADRIDGAVASALLIELPRLCVGQSALRATTQLAVLFGLFGTITGLCVGIGYHQDASSRACALARGISEAMNCNAFGLLVSTISLALAGTTHLRTETLRGELQLVARGVANRLHAHRGELRWLGQHPINDAPTYRAAA